MNPDQLLQYLQSLQSQQHYTDALAPTPTDKMAQLLVAKKLQIPSAAGMPVNRPIQHDESAEDITGDMTMDDADNQYAKLKMMLDQYNKGSQDDK